MPRTLRGHRIKTFYHDAKSCIGRYTLFFKERVIGIFILSVVASYIVVYIPTIPIFEKEPVVPEPKPPPRSCTFSLRGETDITEGTVFTTVYRERVNLRSDFTTVSGDKRKTVHILVKSRTAYVWWNDGNEGIKFPVVERPFIEQLVELAGKDQLTEEDFKCTDWIAEDSKFTVPTNVNFTDMAVARYRAKENNPLIPESTPPMEEISTDARYCSVSVPTISGITYGTVYFGDGDKLRVDMVASSASKSKGTHIIVNSKVAYFWNMPENTGIKFSVTDRPSGAFLNPLTKFECQKWSPDNSVFVPPPYTSFKEASKEDLVAYLKKLQ